MSALIAFFLCGCGGNAADAAPSPTVSPTPDLPVESEIAAVVEDEPPVLTVDDFEDDFSDIAAEVRERPENLFERTYPDFFEKDLEELARWRIGEDNINLEVDFDESVVREGRSALRLNSLSGDPDHIIIPLIDVLSHYGPGYYYLEFYAKAESPDMGLSEVVGGSTGAGWYWRWGRSTKISCNEFDRKGTVFNLNYRGTFTNYGLYISGFNGNVWIDGLSLYWMGIADEDFIIIEPDFDETNRYAVEPETVVKYKSNNGAPLVDAWRVPDGRLEFDVTEALIEHGMGEYYASAALCVDWEDTKPGTLSVVFEDDEGITTVYNAFEITQKLPKGVFYDMSYGDYGGLYEINWAGELKSAKLVLECSHDDPEFLIGDIRFLKMPF